MLNNQEASSSKYDTNIDITVSWHWDTVKSWSKFNTGV